MDEWICQSCTLKNSAHLARCEMCETPCSNDLPSVSGHTFSPAEGATRPHQQVHPLPAAPGTTGGGGTYGWSSDICQATSDNERRIVFLGRTGAGKSATGNNILGGKFFESSACGSSVTKKCQRGTDIRFGRNIQIIDSPGLFDTDMSNADITREVVKCVGMTAPGPHAFVLVVRIDRFTKEEQETVEHFKKVFGDGMVHYLIVLFTRKDDLVHEGKTLEQYLQNVPTELRELLKACHNKCVAFNNHGSTEEKDKDVMEFLNLVDRIYMDNSGQWYTSEMYEEAENTMKQREEQLRQEHERKAKKEKNKIRKQLEKDLKHAQREQEDVASQLTSRIQHLEEKNTQQSSELAAGKKEAEGQVEAMSKELQELRLAMNEMREENEKERRRLKEEVEQMEQDHEERMARTKQDFREKARQEVNSESSGILGMLEAGLTTLMTGIIPKLVMGIASKLLRK